MSLKMQSLLYTHITRLFGLQSKLVSQITLSVFYYPLIFYHLSIAFTHKYANQEFRDRVWISLLYKWICMLHKCDHGGEMNDLYFGKLVDQHGTPWMALYRISVTLQGQIQDHVKGGSFFMKKTHEKSCKKCTFFKQIV